MCRTLIERVLGVETLIKCGPREMHEDQRSTPILVYVAEGD